MILKFRSERYGEKGVWNYIEVDKFSVFRAYISPAPTKQENETDTEFFNRTMNALSTKLGFSPEYRHLEIYSDLGLSNQALIEYDNSEGVACLLLLSHEAYLINDQGKTIERIL